MRLEIVIYEGPILEASPSTRKYLSHSLGIQGF